MMLLYDLCIYAVFRVPGLDALQAHMLHVPVDSGSGKF